MSPGCLDTVIADHMYVSVYTNHCMSNDKIHSTKNILRQFCRMQSLMQGYSTVSLLYHENLVFN
jgi:hypothetical protein